MPMQAMMVWDIVGREDGELAEKDASGRGCRLLCGGCGFQRQLWLVLLGGSCSLAARLCGGLCGDGMTDQKSGDVTAV